MRQRPRERRILPERYCVALGHDVLGRSNIPFNMQSRLLCRRHECVASMND